MRSRLISRRQLGPLLAAALPTLPHQGWGQTLDQGIGGTGVVGDPKEEPSDQMIGGTGVIGTIRRFGSIYVNGLRIAYAPTLSISIDGASASAAHLSLGHVVRVATRVGPGPLSARSIAVEHEVVGPIEALEGGGMTVLGQTVLLGRAMTYPALAVGQPVAVSGLRRLDGSIVASLVETAAGRPFSVAGPLVRASGGAVRIGALMVANVNASLATQRVHVSGRMAGTIFQAARVAAEQADLTRLGASRFSIEGYVGRAGSGLRLGSGLQLGSEVPVPSEEEPAVVIAVMTRHRRLVVEKIERETAVSPTSRQTRASERATRRGHEGGDRGGPNNGSGRGSGGGGGSRGHR